MPNIECWVPHPVSPARRPASGVGDCSRDDRKPAVPVHRDQRIVTHLVETTAAPPPLLRTVHQAPPDRIRMDVAELIMATQVTRHGEGPPQCVRPPPRSAARRTASAPGGAHSSGPPKRDGAPACARGAPAGAITAWAGRGGAAFASSARPRRSAGPGSDSRDTLAVTVMAAIPVRIIARVPAATRKPTLSLRLRGWFLLRFADRQFLPMLFHEPPRRTRPLQPGPLWQSVNHGVRLSSAIDRDNHVL